MNRLDPQTWSSTWQFPVVTSFGSTLPHGYDGPFLEFWQRQVHGPIDHVVDLACGNGALVWLFHELLDHDSPGTRITGVDFADIAPFEALGRNPQDYPSVRFIGNTMIERLPFDDGSIDLAVSQYGLEYSDLTVSIPEIARTLTPAGRLALVLHDRDGWLVSNAIAPLPDYRMILREVEAPQIILELGRVCRAAVAGPQDSAIASEYRRLTAQLDQTTQVFSALYQRNPDIHPVLVYKAKLNQAFQEASKPEAQRAFDLSLFLESAMESLSHNIARLEDLAAIALDESGRQRLCALLTKHGFTVTEMAPLRYTSDQVWGTVLAAHRGDG